MIKIYGVLLCHVNQDHSAVFEMRLHDMSTHEASTFDTIGDQVVRPIIRGIPGMVEIVGLVRRDMEALIHKKYSS